MPHFGEQSESNLATCHVKLVQVAREGIKSYDFSVIKGHRPEHEQRAAFVSGASKLLWPNSAHNKMPSEGMDLVPYPVDWENLQRFKELATVIKRVATDMGIEIEWGYDLWQWDMPHWQLKRPIGQEV